MDAEKQEARVESRDDLLERYTVLIGRYQQQHRHLIDMLSRESVSAEAFATAIDELTADLVQLKMTKIELSRRGLEIDEAARKASQAAKTKE